MGTPTASELENVRDVYRLMATECRYRPAAPSDGLGNITVPEDELDLEAEADAYAKQWWQQEGKRAALVGIPDGRSLRGLVLSIEACRLMCSADPTTATELLKQAIVELKPAIKG